jgi:hypothetical protein
VAEDLDVPEPNEDAVHRERVDQRFPLAPAVSRVWSNPTLPLFLTLALNLPLTPTLAPTLSSGAGMGHGGAA